jgi:hypothetical protein
MKKKFLLGCCTFSIISAITAAAYSGAANTALAATNGKNTGYFAVAKKGKTSKKKASSSIKTGIGKSNNVQTAGMVIQSVDANGVITAKDGNDISYVTTKNAKLKSMYGGVIDKITDDYIGSEIVVTSPAEMPAIYPANYIASEVVFLPKGVSAVTGEIQSSLNNASKSAKLRLSDGSTLIANLDNNVVVENENGENIELSSIKKKSAVTLYYSGELTLSDPPQAYADKIVVNNNALKGVY